MPDEDAREVSVPDPGASREHRSQEGHARTTDPIVAGDDREAARSADPLVATPIEIALGRTGETVVSWKPSITSSPHLFITGIPGQGKSWTTLRLLLGLQRYDVPSLVFDFHGQLAGGNAYTAAAAPTVLDASTGLPFSPFECSGNSLSPTGMNATSMAVAEIFAYVCGLGDIQRDTLYQALRDAYRARGFGRAEMDPLSASYPTMADLGRRIERAEQSQRTHNLMARVRPLLEMDLFRPPADGHSDFIDLAKRGLVIDLHNLYTEALQMAVGSFLLRKVYRDMFGWGMADRLRMAIVLDEAHRLARDATLPKIMKEGRKFGVAVLLASQGLADFHADVVGNAGTKMAFRANYPESRKVAGFFRTRPGLDARTMLEGLHVGQALVQTPEMPVAARVSMYPPHVW